MAAGKTQQQAYTAGGFTYKPANASRFFKRADVRARVREIVSERIATERKSTELAVRKAGLTKEWIVERLMWLAERSLRGKPVMDANGKHTGELTGKPDGPTAVRSLELLGRHVGLFIERHEIGEPGQFARMTDEELNDSLQQKPRMVFVNSMSDLFHHRVPANFIRQVWDIMQRSPKHTFQILTKRPDRMAILTRDLPHLRNVWLGTRASAT